MTLINHLLITSVTTFNSKMRSGAVVIQENLATLNEAGIDRNHC